MSTRKKYTKKQRFSFWEKADRRCVYCGKELELSEMQIDHLFPLNRGGEDEPENLVCACRLCNWYKQSLTVDLFRAQISGIPERLRKNPAFRIAERYGLITVNQKHVTFGIDK